MLAAAIHVRKERLLALEDFGDLPLAFLYAILILRLLLATTSVVLAKCYSRSVYDGAIRQAIYRKLPAILMADKL